MAFSFLEASPALQLTNFADIDAFRPAELMEDARSLPLDVAHFSSARAVVRLPACRIIVMRSFARILDAAYRAPGGMMIIPMSDDLQAQANGMSLDTRFLFALRGVAECHFVEPKSNLYALIIFLPELLDRGWFDLADKVEALAVDRGATMHMRQLVLDILRTASAEPALFEMADVAEHLQEGLLLAADELFCRDRPQHQATGFVGERPLQLVKLLDDFVADNPTSPIYSAGLASEFGVSMRTLGSAITKVRGMSLHRYIRLRKLWNTRARLLKGGGSLSVKTCARAQGFHHMGEFAAMYRAAFNETPSETLARGRQSGAPTRSN